MKQVILTRAGIEVHDVPAPLVEPGAVLVKVSCSCVSTGTELSGVKSSNLPLWKRAMRRPDQVRQVLEMVRTQGLARTRDTAYAFASRSGDADGLFAVRHGGRGRRRHRRSVRRRPRRLRRRPSVLSCRICLRAAQSCPCLCPRA